MRDLQSCLRPRLVGANGLGLGFTGIVAQQSPLVVHTDGEMFCTRADAVHDLKIDLLPKALRVLGKIIRS